MNHPVEVLLSYLEQCEPHNAKWREYITGRAGEVSAWIAQLRTFAARNPDSTVAQIVTVRADGLQSQLGLVLGGL